MPMILALILALAGCTSLAAPDPNRAPACDAPYDQGQCHPDSDLDADRVPLAADNCPDVPNPVQLDTDGDGAGDLCDRCPSDPADDIDGDGRCADADNCPLVANPDQIDADGDGLGDACDPCPRDRENDTDGDGVCESVDNCPTLANPTQLDSDGDGIGQACDNCPMADNPSQVDFDGDLSGDACDEDDDGDGIDDSIEEMFGLSILNADSDGDGVDDETEFGPDLDPLDSDGDGLIDALDVNTPPRVKSTVAAAAESPHGPTPLIESSLLYPTEAVMMLITTEWLSRHQQVTQR